MKRLIFLALGTAVLSGCTGTHIKKPPACDGKHRRPANLYGSILPTLPVPVPPSQEQGQSAALPPPPPPTDAPPPPAPGAPSQAQPAPDNGAANTPPPAPHTSLRDVALSYHRC